LRGYRSFFWPAVLILVGVVALLVNTGRISVDRLYQLVYLWPVILIVIGLELIVRRTIRGPSADVAAALIVLLAIAGAAAYVTVGPNPTTTQSLNASAPTGDLKQASVEIDVGAANITLSGSADLGADLYRAHIEYSGAKPDVSLDTESGTVTVEQSNTSVFGFQDQKFVLDMQLNQGVKWTLSEKSGATDDTFNLAHALVAGVTLNTGASRDDITLGPATGIVPVEIDGGALTVRLHRRSGTEASVAVSGGAVTFTADGRDMRGFGQFNYESQGFAGATDGYRIRVKGGACTVTLDTSTESP
jgi:LiaI-LiaF-like transmembrane region